MKVMLCMLSCSMCKAMDVCIADCAVSLAIVVKVHFCLEAPEYGHCELCSVIHESLQEGCVHYARHDSLVSSVSERQCDGE